MASRKQRARSGSIQAAVERIEADRTHHLTGPFNEANGATSPDATTPEVTPRSSQINTKPVQKRKLANGNGTTDHQMQPSKGFWNDIKSMRWMVRPSTSFRMLMIPAIGWLNWRVFSPNVFNPFEPLLFISYPLPDSSTDQPEYQKGYLDLAFLAYYIIFFCFFRQSIVLYLLQPLARKLGIKKSAQVVRFGEQGYAVIYFSIFSAYGFMVMKDLPIWFYRTEHFWLEYPHWRMTGKLKSYYLFQAAYWVQQLMVLALKLEKPRKDFNELIAHHLVTLWLIGWSYLVNLTWIGNAIFLTMDFSDIFLAFVKCLNYIGFETIKTCAFVWFVIVWTYTRHYLNLKMLYSVWTEFDLVKEEHRQWLPETGAWLAWWMRYQIFVPIAIIQALNLFWYFLIWRILLRAIFSSTLTDERSDDEDDGEPEKDD
jgi:acyl-CoA-dependent ceramide synthase